MTRRRFYVPRDSIRDGIAILPPGQAHHLRNVLRMDSGDAVEIFDGAGTGYAGEVELHGSEVHIRNLKRLPSQGSPFTLTLAAALIKPVRFEWMLQKATELGVDGIIPLRTRLSQIRISPDKIDGRLERWQRIVNEAAKQCGRFAAPRLQKPLEFAELLAADEFSACTKILLYEKAEDPLRSNSFVSDRIVLCIGPEGGWERDEVQQALEVGYQTLGLGSLILRAETAAIAAVSIVQHEINLLRRQ
jgi:16S rRNA (uracil1498-N3)-methyltransferase